MYIFFHMRVCEYLFSLYLYVCPYLYLSITLGMCLFVATVPRVYRMLLNRAQTGVIYLKFFLHLHKQTRKYPSITNSSTEEERGQVKWMEKGWKRISPFQRINDFPILTQFSFRIQTGMRQDINLGKSTEKLGHLWAVNFMQTKQISNLRGRREREEDKKHKEKII